jgi:hypothetical protein
VNLFWSTRRLTNEREDHLTEFLAAALAESQRFRDTYRDLLFAGAPAEHGFLSAEITKVSTQVSFPGTSCCPDMILEMSNGKLVACEHKLEALETMGPAGDKRPQLERYLDLPIDGLVYVRSGWKAPVASTLNHPKYIRPEGRDHFLWRDLYPLLIQSEHVLLDWLREGFERLGFTPPHPSIGEMSGDDEHQNKENRRNFAKLWQATRHMATISGWRVQTGAIVELYLTGNTEALADWVFISPAKAERFLFRATPKRGCRSKVIDRLRAVVDASNDRLELSSLQVRRKNGKEWVVDVTASLHDILGADELLTTEIESRLLHLVEPLLTSLRA